jgi:hypothetical protein
LAPYFVYSVSTGTSFYKDGSHSQLEHLYDILHTTASNAITTNHKPKQPPDRTNPTPPLAKMYKSISLAAIALVGAATASNPWEGTAAPATPQHAPVKYVSVTFQGANPPVAQYQRFIPADGNKFYTNDPLSITNIVAEPGSSCTYYGIDDFIQTIYGTGAPVPVGPPQTITHVVCPQQYGSGYKAKRFVA